MRIGRFVLCFALAGLAGCEQVSAPSDDGYSRSLETSESETLTPDGGTAHQNAPTDSTATEDERGGGFFGSGH